ncbi:MAG: tripartite tricarboxylate transporter substrate-binding protein, partial [Burkholderiales bacterium]
MRNGKLKPVINTANFGTAAFLFLFSITLWGQDFPSRQITIVVPFPAGGGTDTFARAIGQKLAAAFAKPVIVDNRAGATGNIGAEAVARSAPDGHILLYTSSSIALSAVVYSKPAFNPQQDLAPVSMTTSIPFVLVIHPSLPARNVKELLGLARSRPGALNFSSGGTGSALHLPMELFKLRTKTDMHHIPYRGAAPAQIALLTGEVQIAFLVPLLVQAHLKTGRMRALAVSSHARSSILPEVPPLAEIGVADFEALQWHGFFAPVKTASPVVERLHREIVKAL